MTKFIAILCILTFGLFYINWLLNIRPRKIRNAKKNLATPHCTNMKAPDYKGDKGFHTFDFNNREFMAAFVQVNQAHIQMTDALKNFLAGA